MELVEETFSYHHYRARNGGDNRILGEIRDGVSHETPAGTAYNLGQEGSAREKDIFDVGKITAGGMKSTVLQPAAGGRQADLFFAFVNAAKVHDGLAVEVDIGIDKQQKLTGRFRGRTVTGGAKTDILPVTQYPGAGEYFLDGFQGIVGGIVIDHNQFKIESGHVFPKAFKAVGQHRKRIMNDDDDGYAIFNGRGHTG